MYEIILKDYIFLMYKDYTTFKFWCKVEGVQSSILPTD